MKSFITILFLLVLTPSAWALNEGDLRIGGRAGHVGLLGDVGNAAGNALGYGVLFGYHATDEMLFNIGYTASQHKDLKHNHLNVGVDFYINSYDAMYFFLTGGVDFINHDLETISQKSSGFGVYGGAGLDFEVGSRMTAGVEAQYHNAFETDVTVAGQKVKAIQSYATVMLRVTFLMNSKGK